jgi:LETM1 and EF-hand domain-containing protein 1
VRRHASSASTRRTCSSTYPYPPFCVPLSHLISSPCRLVPFVLIALVLEEVIPLLVLYAPFMLPTTCILPSQSERITRKSREKQIVFSALREYFTESARAGDAAKALPLKDLQGPGLQAMCGLLGLSTWGPPPFRRVRIARTLRYLASDDAQLRTEGLGERLTEEELAQALHERGMCVFNHSLVCSLLTHFTSTISMTETLPRGEWDSSLRWWLTSAESDESVDAVARRAWLVATVGALSKPPAPSA